MTRRVLLVLTLLAHPAAAGISDDPPPTLNGEETKHIYSVTAVTSLTNDLETVISCTSVEKTRPVRVGVQVWSSSGATLLNDVDATDLLLSPGDTQVWVTNDNAARFAEDEDLVISTMVNHGSARVIATSSKIVCAAFLVNRLGTSDVLTSLPVFKKVSQKGD
jgi:hypothetical protein